MFFIYRAHWSDIYVCHLRYNWAGFPWRFRQFPHGFHLFYSPSIWFFLTVSMSDLSCPSSTGFALSCLLRCLAHLSALDSRPTEQTQHPSNLALGKLRALDTAELAFRHPPPTCCTCLSPTNIENLPVTGKYSSSSCPRRDLSLFKYFSKRWDFGLIHIDVLLFPITRKSVPFFALLFLNFLYPTWSRLTFPFSSYHASDFCTPNFLSLRSSRSRESLTSRI